MIASETDVVVDADAADDDDDNDDHSRRCFSFIWKFCKRVPGEVNGSSYCNDKRCNLKKSSPLNKPQGSHGYEFLATSFS